MKKGKLYIGTSGWQYKHWKGAFYPDDLPVKDHFHYYCSVFDTVEINNSFYMLPAAETFMAWRKDSPRHFLFSVKGSRYITHMKKLKVDKQSIGKFFRRTAKLEGKLGPVLFQLPPKWKLNAERFESFLRKLPRAFRYTFEFRDHSWYTEKVYRLLHRFKCAFCIYELERHFSPLEITTDFVYVRLHGPGEKYRGSYTESQLKKWSRYCRQWQKEGKDVYIYFDNDEAGYAAINAQKLITLCKRKPGDNVKNVRNVEMR